MSTNKHSLREYESLRAVILTGTATAAAKRLGTSQSAVSRAIAQLEAKTGLILFERSAGRIHPTAEAVELDRSLNPLFETLARVERRDWSSQGEQSLRIGATPTFAHRFLRTLVPSFLRMNDKFRISIEISASNVLVSSVAEQRLDIGITDAAHKHAGVHLAPFRVSRSMCFMPAGHHLSKKASIRPEDLDGENFIALIRRLSNRNVIDQVFRSAGVEPRITIETATAVSASEFVREGLGVTLLSPFPIAASLGNTVILKPFVPIIEYQASFITSASSSLNAAGRAFQRHIRMNCNNFPYSEPC